MNIFVKLMICLSVVLSLINISYANNLNDILSALQKAKAIKERGKIGKGLKHHPLNPMRIIADTKETNLPLGPYESNLEKVK